MIRMTDQRNQQTGGIAIMNKHVPRKQQSMAIFSLSEDRPKISETAFIAPNATVIGQVRLGDGVSVWPGAVIRGDDDLIAIEDGSNVQDGAVIHVDRGHPTSIGKNVTVGHAAVLHGCTIGEGSLIGIHATVLNDVVVGKHSIVGAGTVIPEGKRFPDRSLILGVPGKVVRALTDAEVTGISNNAGDYVARSRDYAKHLKAE
jgi:carbonic anhydrase/acetyltransferase-like protein (isoleucine patch superfamily)